eukprot:4733274-Amphidinium_carterae.5
MYNSGASCGSHSTHGGPSPGYDNNKGKGKGATELWASHSRRILSQDQHAWIDRLWLTESTGGAAYKELSRQILSHMPTHDTAKVLDDVITKCEETRCSDLYSSADVKANSSVDVAVSTLLKMSRNGSPIVDENQGDFGAELKKSETDATPAALAD